MQRFVNYLVTEKKQLADIDPEKFDEKWLEQTKQIISSLISDLEFLVSKLAALKAYEKDDDVLTSKSGRYRARVRTPKDQN